MEAANQRCPIGGNSMHSNGNPVRMEQKQEVWILDTTVSDIFMLIFLKRVQSSFHFVI